MDDRQPPSWEPPSWEPPYTHHTPPYSPPSPSFNHHIPLIHSSHPSSSYSNNHHTQSIPYPSPSPSPSPSRTLQEQFSRISLSNPQPSFLPSVHPNHPPLTSFDLHNHNNLCDEDVYRLRNLYAAQYRSGLSSNHASSSNGEYSTIMPPRNENGFSFRGSHINDLELRRFIELKYNYNNNNSSSNYNFNIESRLPPLLYNSNRYVNNNHNQNRNRKLHMKNRSYYNNNAAEIPLSLDHISFTWGQIKGKVFHYVTDKNLSQFLIRKFEVGHMDGLQLVVSEIKDSIFQILLNDIGSQFFQRFLDFLDRRDITELLKGVTADQSEFVEICCHSQGTRAVQKLLKLLDKNNLEEKILILNAFAGVVINVSENMNGYHVIEELLKAFQGVYEVLGPILEEIAKHTLEIAKDKCGCIVVQHCLGAQGLERDLMLHKIIAYAVELAEDDYGNYVVQHVVVGLNDPHAKSQVIRRMEGSYVYLSKSKFGSHVVQKCLRESDDEHANIIIKEIADFSVLLEICQDPFGNFVAQTLYDVTKEMKGEANRLQHQRIEAFINDHYPFLHSHAYGKKVLAHLRSSKFRGQSKQLM